MNPWLNYHHLYYFMTIAELGSVSKAAEKLRLGQPTLSAQLKQFETVLGVALFHRRNKRLILSSHGKIALDYARQIFKTGGEMLEALNDRLKPSKLSLHLGAMDSIPKHLMVALTQKALSLAPCTVTLLEDKFDQLSRELMSHRLDLVVSNFIPAAEHAKGLYHRSILRQPVHIYASPKFKKLRKDFPKSLSGQPMALPTFDSQLRYGLEHWFNLNHVDIELIAETQDTALKKLMGVKGVAIVPATPKSVELHVRNGELMELGKLHGLFEEVYLIAARRRMDNPVASKLFKSFTI